ncbi:MAG: DUF429 domain-containing protein [Candidatus Nealsonbacteria bacterium]|nr:DUF429 domain-containing protein [Candidatus Nealsonbacteria bacterium]
MRDFFIGIDLGGENKKTTAICVLEKLRCKSCGIFFGKEALKKIRPYLKETKAIAVDAPLTQGRGKGKMRLYEKFLSQKVFREAGASPLPPALMKDFSRFAVELRKGLEKEGFVLDINLIEVFPSLTKKMVENDFVSRFLKKVCPSEDQKSALICAILAYLHSISKTRYLGYRDGFLFLPEMSFWQKNWQEEFRSAWQKKPYLHYRKLTTNLFNEVEKNGI